MFQSFNSASQSISLDSKSFLDRVQGQATELEDVKHQLTSVLRELSNAEEELLRLRQHKSDVNSLEKQVPMNNFSLLCFKCFWKTYTKFSV